VASGEAQESANRLLLSIAEQLKLPLLHIARQAEFDAARGHATSEDLLRMQLSAEAALRLVDSYLLGLQLSQEQASLELEPVSLSSTLVDIVHQLDGFARLYDIDLELHIAGKYAPVMAHAAGMRAAFLSLGYTFIEALPSLQTDRRRLALRLAAHRTPHGLVAGLYSDAADVTGNDLRKAQGLYGAARQPFAGLSSSGGAGIFVADTIFKAMESKLRVGRHQKLTGFAATLQPSRQLQLI
jgi:hypothetical protein